MTEQTLAINYAAPAPLIDPYWIRIEQDRIEDAATADQAAEVLDALFQIEPCNREAGEEPTTTAPVEQAASADTVAEVLDLPACTMEADGSVEATIRVYRSNLAEFYTLRLHGGTVVETVQESGPVEVAVEIAETVTLDYPVVDGFSCEPAPLSRHGNTLRFAADQVGRQCSASYHSQWDRVTVRIAGVEGAPGTCTALAFHHGVAASLELQTPDIAEADLNLCPSSRWTLSPTDYEVTCYKIIEVTQRCTCSGDEVGSYTTEQVVPCPNPEMRCPNNQTTCMHLLGTEPLTEWVECAGDSEIPGRPGQNYALATPAYYEEVCCQKPSATLPQCPIKRTVYKAELPIEHGQAFWRDLYGEATRFKPVAPPAGICGEWIIEQRVDASGCCDGVPPLVWDTSISPSTIAPGSAVVVGVTGGRPPYRWVVDGVGVQWTHNGSTEAVTGAQQIGLSALGNACGPASITVYDGCSSVVGGLRVTAGRWVQLGAFVPRALLLATNPDVYSCATNAYATELDELVLRYSANARYAMVGGNSAAFPSDAATKKMACGSGSLCAQEEITTTTVVDPVVGVFSWEIICGGYWIYPLGTPGNHWRVFWRFPSGSPYMQIFEWVCP